MVNISDPTYPFIVASISGEQLDGAHGISIVGNLAYVSAYSTDALAVVDISDPLNLTIEGFAQESKGLEGVQNFVVAGSYAFATGTYSVTALNLADPSNPTIAGVVTDSSLLNGASDIAVAGGHAFVTSSDYDGVVAVNITDTTSLAIVGSITDTRLNGAKSLKIVGDLAYVAARNDDALTVVNI